MTTPPDPPTTNPEQLTDERVTAEFAALTNPPAIRPDIAELIAKHKAEADHYKTHGTYQGHPQPIPVKEPVPGWMKGIALMAPTVGGGVWLAMDGVGNVLNAITPETLGALGLGVLLVAVLGRSATKRAPKKISYRYDYTGSQITHHKSSGITWKSNNR